jgi:drug/metabolite transporter, DME family
LYHYVSSRISIIESGSALSQFFKNILPYLFVAIAAALWGCIGFFVEYLDQHSFSTNEIVAFRFVSATILLYLYLVVIKPERLKINWKDLHYFIGTGLLSISFFNWSYFTAIRETSLSVAVVLLYTGPAFVVVLSRIIFKERVTLQKLLALIFTFLGIILVAEVTTGGGEFSTYGIIVGVGAGFGYALYSIFSKLALKVYSPLTIIFYTFLIASIFWIPVSGIYTIDSMKRLTNLSTLSWIVGLGFLPTVLAYLLYTEGLKKIEPGKASITAMTEPITATMIGFFMFGDNLNGLQITGILFVMTSVMLIHIKRKRGIRA